MHMCSKPIDSIEMIESLECSAFASTAAGAAATLKAFWRRSFLLFQQKRKKKRRIRSKCRDNRTNSTRCLWQTCDSVDAQRPISRTGCSIFCMLFACTVPMLKRSLLNAFMLHLWFVRFEVFFFSLASITCLNSNAVFEYTLSITNLPLFFTLPFTWFSASVKVL